MARQLVISQMNVRHWFTNKSGVIQSIKKDDPDIILINEHGCSNLHNIKIFGYKTHQNNYSNGKNDGVAIAIKNNIKYKLIRNNMLSTETIAAKIQTVRGDLIVGTTYSLPRRIIFPIQDHDTLLTYNLPAYCIGDYNAHHGLLEDNLVNNKRTRPNESY